MVGDSKDFVIGDLSARLKELMDLLRIKNIKILAEKSGVPYRTLQSYLLGNATPTATTLYKISAAFDVNLNWLIRGEGKPFAADNSTNLMLPAVFIDRLRKDLNNVPYAKLEEISFFSKIPNVLKGNETLSRVEIIQLAKTLKQPIEEYLSLANFFPKIFEVAIHNSKLADLLRSTDIFSAEELDHVLDTISVVLEGYVAKKEKEKNIIITNANYKKN